MKAIIRSLNPEVRERIDEVFGDEWRDDVIGYYEDGVKMNDVTVNLSYMTIETDEDGDGVWLRRNYDNLVKVDSFDYIEIVIR